MAEASDKQTDRLRLAFKQFNPFMLAMFRLGLGQWFTFVPEYSGLVMVITHTGRKTGLARKTPVNYALVDGELYCVAGFGPRTDWYRNILKNPQVEVWLPEGWWRGTAEDISNSPDRVKLMREVIIASGLAGRIAGLDAAEMSDDEIALATVAYRLLHVKRGEARTGPGGPGELAWVWPLATMIVCSLLLLRKPSRRD